MQPVPILYMTDDLDIGGAEQVMFTLVESLPKHKYRPIVCSLENGPLVQRLIQKNLKIVILPKKRPYDMMFLLKLIHLIRKERIKIIHSHSLISSVYGWIAAKSTHTPLVITLHGKSLFNLKRGNNLFPFLAKHCSKVICVSKDLEKEMKRRGLSTKKLVVIYNGINLEKFYKRKPTNNLKKELDFNPSDLIVGSVGTLRAVKNYDCLLESVPQVLNKFPNTKFILVGDGPLKNILQKKAETLGISNSVIFLGQRNDIPRILSIFDLFVLPSVTEGISIALLEAMATELPVVATCVGGNPEVVLDNKTGLLIPPKDPDKLAKAIISLLGDKDKRLTMGKEGRKRVEKRFSIQTMVKQYGELYRSLLG